MGKPLHLVHTYLVGRKKSTIKIDKILTRRKIIPVVTESSWREFIVTGGAA